MYLSSSPPYLNIPVIGMNSPSDLNLVFNEYAFGVLIVFCACLLLLTVKFFGVETPPTFTVEALCLIIVAGQLLLFQ